MFFTEQQLLCNQDYLISLITFFKTVSEKQLEAVRSEIPVTPQMKLGEDGNAHIYVYGPLTFDPDPYLVLYSMWSTTYQSIRNDIKAVYNLDPKPKKVVFHFDSPGGTSTGVDETWEAIMELRDDFEVIAVNEGDMASGAYWLASAANKIISTSETNRQGSIGVIGGYVMEDDDHWLGKIKRLVSKNAKYKLPSIDQEGFDQKLQKNLDELEDVFVARISEGRGLTTNEIRANFGQGSMLLSKAAKKVGMIDAIGLESLNLNLSAKDNPSTNKLTINGESEIMTLEEMLADPGVHAHITQKVIEAEQKGRDQAFADVKAVQPYLMSGEYPETVRDCAIEVCEGKKPFIVLDTLVSFIDQEKAKQAALRTEQDAANQEPLPNIQPNIVEDNERSVADRVKAIKGSEA